MSIGKATACTNKYQKTMKQRIIFSRNIEKDLAIALSECEHDKLFVLTDATTLNTCWPKIARFRSLTDIHMITIPAGDTHKDLASATIVWDTLRDGGATRHSCLINLGGGMVTDLGGFAASTFKRGINFINIPTTLLSMVDASVGGKTGVNYGGLKNEIGVFNDSRCVIINTGFLDSLDAENIRSGYAEMLKHGLLSDDKTWSELLSFDLDRPDLVQLHDMIERSVKVKADVVDADPLEQGLRKSLNLGHTAGHAFESMAMGKDRPVLHGYAVAWGLIVELYLSCTREHFPTDKMRQTVQFIRTYYGLPSVTCKDYDRLFELMQHDKKNVAGTINFTLLSDVGKVRINRTASREEIFEALDFCREGM